MVGLLQAEFSLSLHRESRVGSLGLRQQVEWGDFLPGSTQFCVAKINACGVDGVAMCTCLVCSWLIVEEVDRKNLIRVLGSNETGRAQLLSCA